jgi:YgiT-type zinc finger domain-containing protein
MKKGFKGLCPLCGGKRKQGTTTFSADLGESIVIIRNVPANVCDQCGEAWIAPKAAKRLEEVSLGARAKGAQIEVVAF